MVYSVKLASVGVQEGEKCTISLQKLFFHVGMTKLTSVLYYVPFFMSLAEA